MLTLPPFPDPTRLFAGITFEGHEHIVTAVSGGGDSLALLFLLKSFLDQRANAPKLIAVTVDHGLRPESAEEAGMVARLCAAHDIAHKTMHWVGEKPASGLAEAARDARLHLLGRAAAEAGARYIFTGHTSNDQAETVQMRRARGIGRGEAGIAPATLYSAGAKTKLWFLRPLLGCPRSTLRNYLREAGIGWIDDPSNENPAYERVRVRRQLDDAAIDALLRDAAQAAQEREMLGQRAGALIDSNARRIAPGLYKISEVLFSHPDRQAALYAFRILTALAGGRGHLPEEVGAEKCFDTVARGFCATLSRSVIDRRRSGIYLHRETRNLPGTAPLPLHAPWDGRYWIDGGDKNPGMAVASPGTKGMELTRHDAPDIPQDLRDAAFSAEPALWRGHEFQGLAPYICACAPWARLLPCFDLAAARAISRLCEAGAFPNLPSQRHNKTGP